MGLSDDFDDLAAVRRDVLEDVVTFNRRKRQLDGLLQTAAEMRSDAELILEALRTGVPQAQPA